MTSKKTMVEYAKLKKRPQYFNLFYESCEALSMLDNNSAGKVIHAIADYFIDGIVEKELANFSKSERRCYERIKRGIDDSVEAWTTRVENGRTGAKNRWS